MQRLTNNQRIDLRQPSLFNKTFEQYPDFQSFVNACQKYLIANFGVNNLGSLSIRESFDFINICEQVVFEVTRDLQRRDVMDDSNAQPNEHPAKEVAWRWLMQTVGFPPDYIHANLIEGSWKASDVLVMAIDHVRLLNLD